MTAGMHSHPISCITGQPLEEPSVGSDNVDSSLWDWQDNLVISQLLPDQFTCFMPWMLCIAAKR